MAVSPFGMLGVWELVIITVLGSGAGVPLGVPPRAPDPMMTRVAPEQCLYFTTWAGMAEPDPQSGNQTEQLLAEPEVQRMIAELDRAIKAAAEKMAEGGPREAAMLAEKAPLVAKTLISHAATIYVESVTPTPQGVAIQGALVVDLGDRADEITDFVDRFLDTAPPDVATQVTIEGLDCTQLRLDAPVLPITVTRKDDYLMVVIGVDHLPKLLQRAGTPPPQWLTDAQESLAVPRVASFAYADVQPIMKLLTPLGGAKLQNVVKILDLSDLETLTSVSGLDESGFVSRMRIESADPDSGFGAMISDQPLTAHDLSGIPADSSIALALRMDLGQVLKHGLTMLSEVDPRAGEEVRSGIDQLQQSLGIDIQQDLFPALGNVWTLHAAPSGGGLAAGWTLTVAWQDAAQARETHQQLLDSVRNAFDNTARAPRIRTFEYEGTTAYMLEVPEQGFFVAPSWCLTDSHLVVTLLPQTLKSYLRHTQEGEGSLADHEAVARVLEQGVCSISYQDVRGQFETFYPLLQYGAQVFAHQVQREDFDIDVTKLPSIQAVAPHLLPAVSAARKTDAGFESYMHTTLPGANLGATAPILAGLLVPALHTVRREQVQRQSKMNMKMIGLAMHNHHDVYQGFPAAFNTDDEGKALLSWRVHVLPFLEQQALYEQFHLDEPWNSEHNRKLIAQMPAVYRCPTSQADPGKTVYLGNASKDGVFVPPSEEGDHGRKIGTRFRDIRDGSSNTIMTIEASDVSAVIWTKPDDFQLDEDNPLRGLRGDRAGKILVGLCDGAVRELPLTIDRDTLRGLFTKSGGEVVRDWWR